MQTLYTREEKKSNETLTMGWVFTLFVNFFLWTAVTSLVFLHDKVERVYIVVSLLIQSSRCLWSLKYSFLKVHVENCK